MTIEQQIQSILNDQYNKNNLCLVKELEYPQHDKLIVYKAQIDTEADTANLREDYCFIFDNSFNIYSEEIFMSNNNLLIAQRQDGADGIQPFNLASIRFVKE